MKTDDLLLYGGGALLLYLFLRPKTVAPGVTQVAPVYSTLPVAKPNTGSLLLSAATSLVPVVEKYLIPQSGAQPQAAPLQIQDYTPQNIATPGLTSELPVSAAPVYAYQPVTSDSYLEMFQNGDYPGAEMSGLASYEAAKVGLY